MKQGSIMIDIEGYCNVRDRSVLSSEGVPNENSSSGIDNAFASLLSTEERLRRHQGDSSRKKVRNLFHCPRCTLSNRSDAVECVACGQKNERLEKERLQEALESKQISTLLLLRAQQAITLRDDALKDVLSDSEAEDNEKETSMQEPEENQVEPEIVVCVSQKEAIPSEVSPHGLKSGSPVLLLPAELLQMCFSPLISAKELLTLREVCHSWLVVAEAPLLWASLHKTLVASGKIKAEASANSQKVYDLHSTPQSPSTRSGRDGELDMNADIKSESTRSGRSVSGTSSASARQQARICTGCGLTQSIFHTSSTCSLCAATLPPTPMQCPASSPSRRFAYTKVELLETPSAKESSRKISSSVTGKKLTSTIEAGVMEEQADWFLSTKRGVLSERAACKWHTLKTGWVWLRNGLRIMLKANSAGDAEVYSEEDATARVLKKLASRDWVLLYETLSLEFCLAAESLARGSSVVSTTNTVTNQRKTWTSLQWREMSSSDVLRKVLSCWTAYREWCECIDERCELLNELISQERNAVAPASSFNNHQTPFVRDAALLAFRNNFIMNIHVNSALAGVVRQSCAYLPSERRGSSSDHQGSFSLTYNMPIQDDGANSAHDIFTDRELVEDCRVMNFTQGLDYGGDQANTSQKRTGGAGDNRGLKRPKNYYDWIVERVEKRVQKCANLPPDAAERAQDSEGLLKSVLEMVEELDVPDDHLTTDRRTQGEMRRVLLLPLRRWQAALESHMEAEEPNSNHLSGLMEGIGQKRTKAWRTGRAAQAAVSACRDPGASWSVLSSVFK